jgi:hypothetical protein
LNLSVKYFKEAAALGREEENMYAEISYLYEDLAKATGSVEGYQFCEQILKEGLIKYPNSFLLQYHLCVSLFEKEFFKGSGERNFNLAMEAFSKAKTMVKTQRDREWINALEKHINDNVF